MIKLIATDMDGTFLTDDKKMAQDTDAVLAKLKEMGIRFVVASGRQYPSLERHFPNHLEDIIIIAENGAFVAENKEELISYPMKKEDVILCLDVMAKLDRIEPIVCGKYCGYTKSPEIQEFFSRPHLQYEMVLVEDLYSVLDDAIKVSAILYNGKTNQEGYDELRSAIHEGLYVATSGEGSIDIGTLGVNKGAALAKLQERLGITPEETVVFGDQYNDVELLQQGYYSYAMEAAEEGVKKFARFQGGSNNDGFVTKEIRRLIDMEKNGEKIE
ncbi:HAD family hydrolase [Chakrabartyella piscis]|uniref:Cof-type HAD-IIB family hydrolase n=1 Tax=Chakrabartyella piscis TaxID=2918914 RepID=UPI002958B97F|nr:HAD family hydrolase [Chakrabartyella piscis]